MLAQFDFCISAATPEDLVGIKKLVIMLLVLLL